MRFVHAADIHLDSPLVGLGRYDGAPVAEARGATRAALKNLVTLAIDERAAFVLIAGDLYDGDWRDYNTGLFFNRRMLDLREAGIPVFIASGNHDAASQITRQLSPPGNVTILSDRRPETRILETLGVAICGRSYRNRQETDDLAAEYPAPERGLLNVGVLHTNVDGRPGHENYAPCGLEALRAKGYAYWALGHVHAYEALSREPWIVYPGCVQGRHVRETGPKGCVLVEVDEARGCVESVELRPLDVLRWRVCRIDAREAATADDVADAALDDIAHAVDDADGRLVAARIEVSGASPAHDELAREPERWTNELRAAAMDRSNGRAWIEQVRLDTRPTLDLEAIAARGDAVGELIRGLRDVATDDASIAELAAALSDLAQKLPADLTEGPDAIDLDDPETIRAALDGVRSLLVSRIVAGGD